MTNTSSIEERFYKIYRKHLKNYRQKDTKQICCMWSIKDLPDEIFECDQIYDIENAFSIALTEDEALNMYDMNFKEAVNFIEEKTKKNNN